MVEKTIIWKVDEDTLYLVEKVDDNIEKIAEETLKKHGDGVFLFLSGKTLLIVDSEKRIKIENISPLTAEILRSYAERERYFGDEAKALANII